MISLEQVKLLENKVAKAIEYVERVTAENSALLQKEVEWRERLEANQKRIDELEVLVIRFKEDQSRIEDSILSALDRLNQFEDAIDKSMVGKPGAGAAARSEGTKHSSGLARAAEAKAEGKTRAAKSAASASKGGSSSGAEDLLHEAPGAKSAEHEALDPLAEFSPLEEEGVGQAEDSSESGELDIF
jgi:hypothetical protein